MRRPVGVILAAVILGLIALLGTAIGGLALAALIFVRRPLIPRIPGVELSLYLMFGFQLFCLWTAVDLMRMRRWTRPAMVAIGGIVFVLSALAGAGLIWARQFAALLLAGPSTGEVQAGVLSAAVICFAIALAGVWWIVYFCRACVKTAFRGAGFSQQSQASVNRVTP
jgi:hypothetical protein